MVEANKFADLFKVKNLFRYFKIGVTLTILFGVVVSIVNLIVETIVKALGIDVSQGLMFALQVGGITVGVVALIGIVIQTTIGGFLVEYINNSKAGLIKWVRK